MVGLLSYSYGTLVVDGDDPDPDLAVVVNHPKKVASEWEIDDAGTTVADLNPEYPTDSPLIVVVFKHTLDGYDPQWEKYPHENRPLTEFAEAGIPYYTFPRERITTGPPKLVSETIDPTIQAKAIHDRLADQMDCYYEDPQTVIAEKFDDTYRLRHGEIISGDGVLYERLQTVVDEVAAEMNQKST